MTNLLNASTRFSVLIIENEPTYSIRILQMICMKYSQAVVLIAKNEDDATWMMERFGQGIDIIILDRNLSGEKTIPFDSGTLIAPLRARWPKAKIIGMSMVKENRGLLLEAGCHEFMWKMDLCVGSDESWTPFDKAVTFTSSR
jgi:DNA-binding NarL/FixJ family response regulator